MNDVFQDPEKLRDFAYRLSAHGQFLKQSIGGLGSYMSRLGQTWRDDQFNEFEDEVHRLKLSLDVYAEKIETTVIYLEATAEAAKKIDLTRM